MSVLPDHWIDRMAKTHRMIEPYARNRVRAGTVSFGTSSYGYDFRLAREFKIPDLEGVKLLDPKRMGTTPFVDIRARTCVIPPNSFVLGRSQEYFRIPRDVLVICQGKSTYSRCGVVVNITPFEPGWEGFATIALVNTAPVAVKVYGGEGIAQMIFVRAESECTTSYSDRKGKYQAQRHIQVARV